MARKGIKPFQYSAHRVILAILCTISGMGVFYLSDLIRPFSNALANGLVMGGMGWLLFRWRKGDYVVEAGAIITLVRNVLVRPVINFVAFSKNLLSWCWCQGVKVYKSDGVPERRMAATQEKETSEGTSVEEEKGEGLVDKDGENT